MNDSLIIFSNAYWTIVRCTQNTVTLSGSTELMREWHQVTDRGIIYGFIYMYMILEKNSGYGGDKQTSFAGR